MLDLHLPQELPQNADNERKHALHEAEFVRSRLIGDLDARLSELPAELTIEDAAPLAFTLDLYANLGTDFVHLMRFYLGCLALRVLWTLGHGKDAIGQCAEAWNLAPTTLRFYAAAAKRTQGKVKLFDAFLVSIKEQTSRPATQEHVKEFGRAMKQADITPRDVAEQIAMRSVEQASEQVEKNLQEIEDDDHRTTAVVAVAGALGVQLDLSKQEPSFGPTRNGLDVSRETGPIDSNNGYTDREVYARQIEADLVFLDAAYEEWYDGHKPSEPPVELAHIREVLRWSIEVRHPLTEVQHEQA